MKTISKLYIFLFFIICTFSSKAMQNLSIEANSLSHKNGSTLNQYLNFIGQNLEEKIGILPYILEKESGTFLEVGAGGDSINLLLSKIPEKNNVKIIVTDIDPDIVASIPKRNPCITKYIDAKSGPSIILKQLDATDMSAFQNQSIDGINASALVHEIISYAGKTGEDSFFLETSRVLKDGGMLIYRDPEGISLVEKNITITILSRNMKLFINIFLPKFLDLTYTKHIHKQRLYDPKLIKVDSQILLNNNLYQKEISGEEFMQTSTQLIDFEKPLIINLPQGLAKEIERHYLTFLHQCNPLEFIHPVSLGQNKDYEIKYYTNEIQQKIFQLLKDHNIIANNGKLSEQNVAKLKKINNEQINYIENGIRLKFLNQKSKESFIDFLIGRKIDPKIYVTNESIYNIILDYKIFALLYENIKEFFLDNAIMQIESEFEEEIAKYLKREGEEHYFYASPDEFITYVGRITIKKTSTNCTILAPINPEANTFIPRTGYQELLTKSIIRTDEKGELVTLKEGKRIINFKKVSIIEAIGTYQAIINNNQTEYPKLKIFVKELRSKI